jgi:hypothetical protein
MIVRAVGRGVGRVIGKRLGECEKVQWCKRFKENKKVTEEAKSGDGN